MARTWEDQLNKPPSPPWQTEYPEGKLVTRGRIGQGCSPKDYLVNWLKVQDELLRVWAGKV